jgi:hypothetical protein
MGFIHTVVKSKRTISSRHRGQSSLRLNNKVAFKIYTNYLAVLSTTITRAT